MKNARLLSASMGLVIGAVLSPSAWSATGTQVGPTGKTYASAGVICEMHPKNGMAPMAHAGLYNPASTASATVSLNSNGVAVVTFASPDASVWLDNKLNTVAVALNKRTSDSYAFDATPFAGQLNVCLPNTTGNTFNADRTLEYSVSGKSYATVTPGCAFNSLTGRAQPYVNFFDNGSYLLNVSINNTPLTQLNGTTRKSTPIFLAPGYNVISAVNGSLSIDYYVRHGGAGTCTLP